MEELKILNKQVSEQKKPSKVKLSSNNVVLSDLGKRFSKGPKLSMRLDRKSKLSIPESILVSEEEELKIERENINQILGGFKDTERKVLFFLVRITKMKTQCRKSTESTLKI